MNDKCPHKRQRRRPCEDGSQDWSYTVPSQGTSDPLQTVTGEEGAQSCQGVRVSGFQSPARMNVCCSKPLALWGFVAVALGNVYTDFASS